MTGLAAPAIGQGNRRVKMILNWRYQGPQSWFFLAQDNGCFADAGIDMVMDQGSGSGAARVRRWARWRAAPMTWASATRMR